MVGGALTVIISHADSPKDSAPQFPFSLHACDLSLSLKQGHYFAGAWCSVLAFDTVIVISTYLRAVSVRNVWPSHLFQVAVRDSIIYYVVLVGLVLSNILTFLVADPLIKGLTSTMINTLSSGLIARLMLTA
ncbi:hypothetical protein B0H21DRAFT_1459 [Amylocystis lapponica]|nr:hypothetical protein B0H21DRAFT_1459 [Amylocystis lapponica]